MAITVTLQSGNPGKVLVTLPGADLTSGKAWTLTGATSDSEWDVAGGAGTGDGATQVVLVDAACPLNILTTYTLTVDGSVASTGTVTRTYSGWDAIMPLDASAACDFFRRVEGGDRREYEPRFWAVAVPGSARPPVRLAPVAGDGGGSLMAETDSTNTALLRSMIAANSPLYVFHNPTVCDTTGCTIPLVDLVIITRASSDVLHGLIPHSREWSLSYLLIDNPDPDYRVSLSTWGEAAAAVATWGEAAALAATWGAAELVDWTTVGS